MQNVEDGIELCTVVRHSALELRAIVVELQAMVVLIALEQQTSHHVDVVILQKGITKEHQHLNH